MSIYDELLSGTKYESKKSPYLEGYTAPKEEQQMSIAPPETTKKTTIPDWEKVVEEQQKGVIETPFGEVKTTTPSKTKRRVIHRPRRRRPTKVVSQTERSAWEDKQVTTTTTTYDTGEVETKVTEVTKEPIMDQAMTTMEGVVVPIQTTIKTTTTTTKTRREKTPIERGIFSFGKSFIESTAIGVGIRALPTTAGIVASKVVPWAYAGAFALEYGGIAIEGYKQMYKDIKTSFKTGEFGISFDVEKAKEIAPEMAGSVLGGIAGYGISGKIVTKRLKGAEIKFAGKKIKGKLYGYDVGAQYKIETKVFGKPIYTETLTKDFLSISIDAGKFIRDIKKSYGLTSEEVAGKTISKTLIKTQNGEIGVSMSAIASETQKDLVSNIYKITEYPTLYTTKIKGKTFAGADITAFGITYKPSEIKTIDYYPKGPAKTKGIVTYDWLLPGTASKMAQDVVGKTITQISKTAKPFAVAPKITPGAEPTVETGKVEIKTITPETFKIKPTKEETLKITSIEIPAITQKTPAKTTKRVTQTAGLKTITDKTIKETQKALTSEITAQIQKQKAKRDILITAEIPKIPKFSIPKIIPTGIFPTRKKTTGFGIPAISRKRRKGKKAKRKYAYTPGFTAVFKGIKVPKMKIPAKFTGLEVRPIIKKRKRRSRKNAKK